MEDALKEVERVIKAKGGNFKLSFKPQVIGDSSKDKDLDEISRMPGERDSGDEDSSVEEDNEEGMGDLDLGEEAEGAAGEDDVDEDGEERKESKPKKAKKSKKKKDSEDEEDDQ